MNLHETEYGRRFFNSQLPNLIKALERIAESLSAPKQSLSADFVADTDFLHDLYYGDYEPSVFKTQSEHQKQLNHNASMAEELLRQKMGNSPEAIAAFEAYQLAAGECSSIVAEQAFESGFQTAVQMLVAGLIPPENKFAAEVPLTTQHNYIGTSATELRKEALQLHIDRVFDNPQWGGYLPFNKRYRPEVWRAAHIVYVRNECCHKISPVTQEQIDHAYNGTIPCPHCGRWSEFIVLGIRLQPEPLVPCLSCDCHDPDMGCTMPSIDKSYACPLVSCDDEQTEVLDE